LPDDLTIEPWQRSLVFEAEAACYLQG